MLWLELEAVNSLVSGKASTELSQREGDENFLLQPRQGGCGCANCSVFLPAESSGVCLRRVPRARGDSRALPHDSWQSKAEEITCASTGSALRGVGMFVRRA